MSRGRRENKGIFCLLGLYCVVLCTAVIRAYATKQESNCVHSHYKHRLQSSINVSVSCNRHWHDSKEPTASVLI